MSRFVQDPIPGMPQDPGLREPTADPIETVDEPNKNSEPRARPNDDKIRQPVQTPDSASPIVTALRVLNGPYVNCLLDIPDIDDEILLGRNDPPAIAVDIDMTEAELGDPPMVSRRHAVLRREPRSGELTIEDIGSTNGTWVDGDRLNPGDPAIPVRAQTRLRVANIKLVAVAVEKTI